MSTANNLVSCKFFNPLRWLDGGLPLNTLNNQWNGDQYAACDYSLKSVEAQNCQNCESVSQKLGWMPSAPIRSEQY